MANDNLTEARLIEQAAAGNLGAFAQLVREYRPLVMRTAYGIMGSAQEAEDVAQEVFIKVWNNLPRYHTQGTFTSWLYRIAVNTAIDTLRKRRQVLPLEDWQPDSREPPEDMLLRKDAEQKVRQALEQLPPNARAALTLREYEQLSYKEIAEVLQIPIGTVMSRLNYARQALRKLLISDEHPEGGPHATPG
jgi:RNA polymerase sigma-70 factor, ECF subfamily